ncbi:hydroxylamine reductase [Desulfocurvibacter africanus PCS]|uniref:Hydroxylamine reductase n=1 Tax=Desulfocurvibacter africanus PCS TaxID=1262666 RepID=M5PSJ5_DESAF|nr:hydroxylamine reductase [Desulfocurvibacter africanus]EMG37347.1 hydroxylamine reductase [Desulfocurvibacter africanus PCS]
MFCYQCEQAAKGEGCTKIGVCGKQPEVSDLQDLTAYVLRGLSLVALEGRKTGNVISEADQYTVALLFSTLTNVNFDPEYFVNAIRQIVRYRDELRAMIENTGRDLQLPEGPATFEPAADSAGVIRQAQGKGLKNYPTNDPDIASLMHTVLFGLKGVAAYTDHAQILGVKDEEHYKNFHEALAAGWDGKERGLQEWVGLALKVGELNLKAMELLDKANTGAYGNPVPTQVPLGHRKNKAILISGHDLRDLHMLLEQTKGKGIDIYTHGEMLPTHGYPELKKYENFYGNWGTAWQNQQKEFPTFPGAILMTTNCLQRAQHSYEQNLFTTGLVGWPSVMHIEADSTGYKDFSPVINRALELPGFTEDEDRGHVMVGFGHDAVLGVADKIIDAVKSGAIRHFFLVGGCDGAKPGRNYYTEFVEKAPKDTVILTLACGKYRFYDKDLGTIGGLPRLIDIGQCNDSYSAIQIAVALSKAFNVGVNELPLSMILSWYEQKAVAILLTLLALGIKNIRLGPSLPAFITPNVLNFLVQNYDIKPISTAEEDLQAILGKQAA